MSIDNNNEAMPVVSVIMPVYNCARYVKEAIRSVLAQSYPHFELIVVDDGSKDETRAIVKELAEEDGRIRLLCNPENMGVAKTRNRGLEQSVGEYVAFLDGDDVWLPEKLERQLALMRQTGADIVYSSYAIVDGEGRPIKEDYLVPESTDFEQLLKENVIGCSTALLRGGVARAYRFTVDFFHEDYCMWLDMLRDGHKAAGCTQVLVNWRLISNSRSYNKQNSARHRWRIYRKYLKIPFFKSTLLFFHYMISGIKKYYG